MGIINRIYNKFRTPFHLRNGNNYILWLRSQGVRVGENCVVMNPSRLTIDCSIPDLLTIGDNVFMHYDLTIMTHDWAGYTLLNKYNDFVPSHAAVHIGNNVWFGMGVTVLKGVTIGDNVIVGAGSIVTKSIPSDSVAVGSPAKVVCSLDEYYHRRKTQSYEETILFALEIFKNGRTPVVDDFYDDYPAFVDASNYKEYNFNYKRQFSDEQFAEWLKHHKAPYNGFDEFMNEVRKRL